MNNEKYKLLLVEDSQDLGYLLTEYLRIKNFEVKWLKRAQEALKHLQNIAYDMAILDVTMPEMDGFELAKQIKTQFPELPFIFLTARSLKVDVLKGFHLGAVDYLKKPIDEEELVIRIENLLARIAGTKQEVSTTTQFKLGAYNFNSLNQELCIGSQVIYMTNKESELLHFLAMRTNELCSHKDILLKLWGNNDYFNRKSLNVFITRLRKYLGQDPEICIDNIHGQGFILRTGN
ncbi:response regulator transcription factor [Maribacter hydrothermalis]|uniref:Two-component system response regulator n=1 Tax=Maribacter hydrothermalis TaxID=1836467 RepID=A0A1B7ZBD8_9FLAO|nr:response regulator transcription factor [Maribacter hydrothermalis]APQ16471.1 two-component system response regulator [Maribacter hydrothermalis]OBR40035.1 two-component system response regulator [Maribacter hydrothermalis]